MKKIFLSIFFFCILQPALAQAPDYLWAKKIGGTGYDVGYSITCDAAGNVYTTGYFEYTVDFDPGAGVFNLQSVGGQDIFISKLDASGNFVWARALGSSFGTGDGLSIALDASNNIYATGLFTGTIDFDPGPGTFNLTSYGNEDTFISKLDSSGNFVWAKAIGGFCYDHGTSIDVDASGNVYTIGYFNCTVDFDPGPGIFNLTATPFHNVFISKLDSQGNFVWAKQIGGSGGLDDSYVLTVDSWGNVFAAGRFFGTPDFDPDSVGIFNLASAGGSDIFVTKLDTSGNFVWAKAMGGMLDDRAYSITLAPSTGDVYITGYFDSIADFDPGAAIFNLTSVNINDVFISKLDNSGNFIWAKAFGGPGSDGAYSVSLDNNGNVYTTGFFQLTADFDPGPGVFNLIGVSSGFDIFVSKLDVFGNFVWAKAAGGTAFDFGCAITVANGSAHVTGYFMSQSISFGSTTFTNASTAALQEIFIVKLDTSIGIPTGNTKADLLGNGLLVFPSPATEEIIIQCSTFKAESVEIYDVIGEKVFSQTINSSQQTIHVARLTPGIYFVKVRSEKQEHIAKFVKQ